MKSGTILAKAYWVITRCGPVELFKRAQRYFKNYKIQWLWVYRSRESAYRAWLKKEAGRIEKKLSAAEHDIEKFSLRPLISILMPVSDAAVSNLEGSVRSLINQAYPAWELIVAVGALNKKEVDGILSSYTKKGACLKTVATADFNQKKGCIALEAAVSAQGDFIGFLECGDVLAPHALLEVARLYNENPGAEVIYSDEDCLQDKDIRFDPFFKPDWAPGYMFSQNYINHFFVTRKDLLEGTGCFKDGTAARCCYDLMLRLTEQAKNIVHIPEILYHSRSHLDQPVNPRQAESSLDLKALEGAIKRRGLKGEALEAGKGRYRVKFKVRGEPLVSIIIPVRDKIDLLRLCINSIKEKSTYQHYEIIVVDNGSTETESKEYFKELQGLKGCRVLSFDEPFNYSRINNFASNKAGGELLLFLNNDIEVISPGWLEEMVSHCQRPGTGAVGAKLLFPDRRIQHAGVVVGLRQAAMHAFHGIPDGKGSYMDMAEVLRNYSAVTAACMMTPRNVFDEAGGFDEGLAVAYNDVDLCLRVSDKGYFIVWTPYALLYHHESASRGQYYPEHDLDYFCEKWELFLKRGDPFYNPNLSLNHSDFRVKI